MSRNLHRRLDAVEKSLQGRPSSERPRRRYLLPTPEVLAGLAELTPETDEEELRALAAHISASDALIDALAWGGATPAELQPLRERSQATEAAFRAIMEKKWGTCEAV